MSFSGNVKKELEARIPSARHCQLAELAGLFHFCGYIGRSDDGTVYTGFKAEREGIVRKGFTLLKKTYNIVGDNHEDDDSFRELLNKIGDPNDTVNPLILKNQCCQRDFLRGVFLAAGSVNDPSKAYHLEIVCGTGEKADQVKKIMKDFEIEARVISRRKSFVVYLKDGESISLFLSVIEATNALMEMENARIYKEVNNTVNRRVNCEMSNIRKTVESSSRQIEDIIYIRDHYGFEKLPESLAEMAEVRLEFPEAPLWELGERLDPPVGKSGVNHRLRRLGDIARSLRGDAE